jgi:GNAT superfamily N-acetyltransferase
LNLICFGWLLSPDQVKLIRKVDKKRVPDYFALYAVEKEDILGQIGVVTVDTQCAHGIEKIGYIWGVCTKPSAAKRGFAKKLMGEVHERLQGENIRYSFLGTGKSLVAYNLYRGLDYSEFTILDRGIKVSKSSKVGHKDITFTPTPKNETVVNLFKEYSKDLMGFVKRPNNFLEIRKAWSWMPYNFVGVFKEDKKPIGYTIASIEGKIIKVRELCCPKIEDLQRCINALEREYKPNHMLLEWVIGSHLEKDFIKSGFKLFSDSWGTLMVKDLKGKHSVDQIRKLYGTEEDKFHMTSIDEY